MMVDPVTNHQSMQSTQQFAYAGVGGSTSILYNNEDEMPLWKSLVFSTGLHVGSVIAVWLVLLLLQFLGIHLFAFDRPERLKDIEFQLVTAPEQKPRDPNTKNRAERNTRSGGEKTAAREAENLRKAGAQQPKPKPQQQPQKATKQQKPQPKKPQQPQKPVAQKQPKQQQKPTKKPPAPPRPKQVKKPTTKKAPQIAAVPNPLAPIKIPDAPAPAADTGPVIRDTSNASGSSASQSSSASVAPATVPGQFSAGSRPSSAGGGPSGQGGSAAYSQMGSPGGGGGRPGIDAIAEPDFGPYLAELQRRIRRNWVPPEDREDKTVILIFTVSRDGRLLDIKVKQSSGFQNADQAAFSAVERSAPFRPLPPEYRNSSINIEFTFDYNVYKGKMNGLRRRR